MTAIEQETEALKRRIATLEEEIDAVKARRDAHAEGNALWMRYDDELKQLRSKEEQLRDALKRKELQCERAGQWCCRAAVALLRFLFCATVRFSL